MIRKFVGKQFIKAFVAFCYDEQGSTWINRSGYAMASLLQQCSRADYRTELLRPIVTGNRASHRTKTSPFTASKYHAPKIISKCPCSQTSGDPVATIRFCPL